VIVVVVAVVVMVGAVGTLVNDGEWDSLLVDRLVVLSSDMVAFFVTLLTLLFISLRLVYAILINYTA